MYRDFHSFGQTGLASIYRSVGAETELTAATPHRLIEMLFEALFEAMADARGAIRDRDIVRKCRALSKAVRIVEEGLIGALNFEGGGALAENLNALYDYVLRRLTYANLHGDVSAVDECQRLLTPIKEAWEAIGSSSNAKGN